jgi:hypothetical protein
MTNRSENVIEFPGHRAGRHPSRSKRQVDRSSEAADLLDRLRRGKRRLAVPDRQFLAANLGRLIMDIERSNPKLLAKKILGEHWEKRMRYVRFPDDTSDARYAASGAHFAGLIDELIKERVNKGLDPAQATKEIVYGALKRTSFLPPSRSLMPEGGKGEVPYLVGAMEQVVDKLAQDTDLAEHFDRVSKHPIYPDCPYYEGSNTLKVDLKYHPNDIYEWDWITDDNEIDLHSLPWWAPKCLIGYLYIAFESQCLHLPKKGTEDLKEACGGEVTSETWRPDHSDLLSEFLTPEFIRERTIYHRLPVLLVVLPKPTRLLPCLYVATGHPTGFQEGEEFSWICEDNPMMPRFVAAIGSHIDDDDAFFHDGQDDNHLPFYISVVNSQILAIGSGVDDNLWEFTPDLCLVDASPDLPEWLQSHPVQKLLKLAPNSDTDAHFALALRRFPGRQDGSGETVFRPAFPDRLVQTPLRQDTIGGYLLRSLSSPDGIFEALKTDALAKITKVKQVIDSGLSKFQDTFDAKFGK